MSSIQTPTARTVTLPSAWSFEPERPISGPTPWTKVPRDDLAPLTFAVVGDATGLGRPGVFAQALRQVSWLKPDFIISVGDMIEGYTDDRCELGRMWDGVENAARASACPFFVVPGNHDMGNAIMLDVWHERFGPDHYAFTYKSALFIVLNTEDPPLEAPAEILPVAKYLTAEMARDPEGTERRMAALFDGRKDDPELAPLANTIDTMDVNRENISERQFDFLAAVLARRKDIAWTFVFFHKPLWQRRTANWLRIEAMLADRPHTAFCGHTHYFAHAAHGRGDYFNMAMTGAMVHTRGVGCMDHTLLVSCRDGDPSFVNIRLDGLLDKNGQHGQLLLR
jgi:3',5'-cyclic AMP phosphodiesterase CpdA